jgi:hypothetical protein
LRFNRQTLLKQTSSTTKTRLSTVRPESEYRVLAIVQTYERIIQLFRSAEPGRGGQRANALGRIESLDIDLKQQVASTSDKFGCSKPAPYQRQALPVTGFLMDTRSG